MRRGLSTFTPGRPSRPRRARVARARAGRAAQLGASTSPKRITVNLAPAHVRKAGPGFDLAIAVGVLAASEQVPREALADAPSTASCPSPASCAPCAARSPSAGRVPLRLATCLSPEANAPEAALVDDIDVRGVASLDRIADLLHGRWNPSAPMLGARPAAGVGAPRSDRRARPGRREAGARDCRRGWPQPAHDRPARVGQDDAGPPASGDPATAEPGRGARVTQMHSAARARERPAWRPPALSRAPPHDLAAGPCRRRNLPAGEITLAHRGVLFLDELPEFSAGPRSTHSASPWRRVASRSARAAHDRLPGQRDAGGRLQPLPLRPLARALLLRRGRDRSLPAAAQRPAARSDRPRVPSRAGAAARAGWSAPREAVQREVWSA